MHNLQSKISFSALSICYSMVGVLVVSYIGLIAVVMSYGALTVEFSQSVKNDQAVLATLEGQYLAGVHEITGTNYGELGYAKPQAQSFVRGASVTALR